MAKNKEEKTNVMRVLEQKKIAYTAHSYPHEEGVAVDGVTVAKSMGFDPAQVFKTLVARGASGQYYVFDVPVAESLDLKKAARAVGEKSIEMLTGGHEEAVSDGFPQLGGKPADGHRVRGEDRLSGGGQARRPDGTGARGDGGHHRGKLTTNRIILEQYYMLDQIFVKGARENNLKNIDVSIPRDKLTVITGLSGSGKSSLAFDTIYAEGQRRYVESLSSYARMFLGQKEKPDVDYIDGLSPAISIDQKTTSQNPRSTVGTVTEIYDYLRLLWARVGTPHCPNCGKEIKQQTIDQIVDQVMALGEGTRIQVMAPVIRGKKGEYAKIFEDARKSGYVRVRVDGSMYDLSEEIKLEKNIKHSIEVVVDRLILKPDVVHRLSDSAETAAALSGGLVLINVLNPEQDILFSQNYACEDCGVSIEELTPRMFSFNNPFGACPACTGLGSQLKVDPELVIPNKTLSILDGAICASGWNNVRGDGISRMYFDALSKKYHFSLREPVEKLSPEVMDVILYGTKGEKLELHYDQPRGKGVLYQPFEGIVNNLERRYQETQSESVRAELEECMSECPCPACQGRRLRRESLAVTVGGMDIDAFTRMSVTEEIAFVDSLTLTEQQLRIGERILKEIKNRLGFLQSVGPSDCTSATTTSCSRRSSVCATSAIR